MRGREVGAREIARAYPSKWGREDVFMSNGRRKPHARE